MADRVFRVRRSGLAAVLAMFPGATECEPPTALDCGCTDPGHCPQHPGVTATGDPMAGVRVPGVSGRGFHRRLVAARLTEE